MYMHMGIIDLGTFTSTTKFGSSAIDSTLARVFGQKYQRSDFIFSLPVQTVTHNYTYTLRYCPVYLLKRPNIPSCRLLISYLMYTVHMHYVQGFHRSATHYTITSLHLPLLTQVYGVHLKANLHGMKHQ